MADTRKIAYKVLLRVLKDDAYSVLTLNSEIKKNNLDNKDSSFVSALTYGVLENLLLLEDILKQYSNIPIKKIDIYTKLIIYLGIYQLIFMDKVPDSAAVNESVKLSKKLKLYRSSGFINAVLRNIVRNDKKYEKSDNLSVKYSVSEDILKILIDEYGTELTEKMLKSLQGRADITIRINTLKTDKDNLLKRFEKENVIAKENKYLENTLSIEFSGSIENIPSFKDGLFFVQDFSSQLCCEILGAESGDILADICSAPGGKSICSAIKMNNEGKVYSYDLYQNKLNLIDESAKRLGIDIIKTKVRDARDEKSILPAPSRIICDVPCSGLGIMRRKPEIRYKKDTNIDLLPDLQYDILCVNMKSVPINCDIIYSTCTLNPEENRKIIDKFLENHKNFEPVEIKLPAGIEHVISEKPHMLTILPSFYDSDGFFIAKMRKAFSDD